MNIEIEKRIGQNLKELREAAEMTQDCPADRLQLCGYNLTRSAVAKI